MIISLFQTGITSVFAQAESWISAWMQLVKNDKIFPAMRTEKKAGQEEYSDRNVFLSPLNRLSGYESIFLCNSFMTERTSYSKIMERELMS